MLDSRLTENLERQNHHRGNLGSLGGLRVPITHYTTYTYFTTLGLPSGSVTTITRTQVVSNVVTDTIRLGQPLSTKSPSFVRATRTRNDGPFTRINRRQPLVTSVLARAAASALSDGELEAAGDEHNILHSPAPRSIKASVIKLNPRDLFSGKILDTELTTSFADPIASSSASADQYRALATNAVDVKSVVNTYKTRKDDPFLTHETTLTYLTTYFDKDKPVATSTRKAIKTEVIRNTLLNPSPTKKPLVVRRTRLRGIGSKEESILTSRRPLIVITKKASKDEVTSTSVPDHNGGGQSSPLNSLPQAAVVPPVISQPSGQLGFGGRPNGIAPTPVTYYTTYTHFTTELINGRPIVRSREQVFTTVIRDRVLPTRAVIGLRSQPLPSSNNNNYRFRRSLEEPIDVNDPLENGHFYFSDDDLMMEESDPIGMRTEADYDDGNGDDIVFDDDQAFHPDDEVSFSSSFSSSSPSSASSISGIFEPSNVNGNAGNNSDSSNRKQASNINLNILKLPEATGPSSPSILGAPNSFAKGLLASPHLQHNGDQGNPDQHNQSKDAKDEDGKDKLIKGKFQVTLYPG